MYNALGYGKGDSILACFAIAIGIPAYVPHLRAYSSAKTHQPPCT